MFKLVDEYGKVAFIAHTYHQALKIQSIFKKCEDRDFKIIDCN